MIVGAGVSGLGCAALLASVGLRVQVLEAASEPGGRARSTIDPATGDELNIGPHVVSTGHCNFMRLLRLLGTDDQVLWQPDPVVTLLDGGERLRMPGRNWPVPLHGLPMLPPALRRMSTGDVLSQWRLGWRGARANEPGLRKLDGIDALHWLRSHGVSERAIDWFWRTALLAVLNVRLEDCSAAAAMRVFRLMLGRSGFHFGFPKVGLSQLYVPGCAAAVERAGGALRCGVAVERIAPMQEGPGVLLSLAGGERLAAAQCVLALPPAPLEQLLARSGIAPLAGLQAQAACFRPNPYVSTTLWLDRRVTQERFWARVAAPGDLNSDFYDLANIRPALAGRPSVVAANAIGPNARPEWSDTRIVARTLEELAEFAPAARAATVRHACVHRIAMAIPMPRPGTETCRPATRTALEGLWLAGDWTDTAVPCSMESAARSAALAAESVLRRLGQPARLALPPAETQGVIGWLRSRSAR